MLFHYSFTSAEPLLNPSQIQVNLSGLASHMVLHMILGFINLPEISTARQELDHIYLKFRSKTKAFYFYVVHLDKIIDS